MGKEEVLSADSTGLYLKDPKDHTTQLLHLISTLAK